MHCSSLKFFSPGKLVFYGYIFAKTGFFANCTGNSFNFNLNAQNGNQYMNNSFSGFFFGGRLTNNSSMVNSSGRIDNGFVLDFDNQQKKSYTSDLPNPTSFQAENPEVFEENYSEDNQTEENQINISETNNQAELQKKDDSYEKDLEKISELEKQIEKITKESSIIEEYIRDLENEIRIE